MCALGSPVARVAIAVWNCVRKVSVEVMVSGEAVHTSLAPIRIVTYCAPWLTALAAWVGAADILDPETASLYSWPTIAGLACLRRS